MKRIVPSETSVPEIHQYIIGTVVPRPIAFASTMDADGHPNLAPFSFFNAFAAHPPILVFSPNRRVKDGSTKDTLRNVETTGEVVINIVSYDFVRQMALASIDYPAGVNEFEKSGLTPIPSEMVKPFRVKESRAHYECKVRDIVKLGDEGGAGNLIICDVLLIHIDENLFDAQGKIDPQQLDPVARLGRTFYARVHGDSIFSIVQPQNRIGIGFDQLPEHVRRSTVLTGNDLAELASVEQLPSPEEILAMRKTTEAMTASQLGSTEDLHRLAAEMIRKGAVHEAWKVLLA